MSIILFKSKSAEHVMSRTLKAEQVGIFIAAVSALIWLSVPWWVYLLLLLGPDISMLGYLAGNKIGGALYNIFHLQGVGAVLVVIGLNPNYQNCLIAGLIIIGHSSMDRIFGYGLKYLSGFKYTHLGEIGKNKID